ncbi:MAG TPA: SLC13 family permease [Fibrobacteria bacterium]|nr:SLC13 family permease [Fibrobacteria bacterium]
MSPATTTLVVLGLMTAAFFTQIAPFYVTALSGAIALGLLGIIPMAAVFTGLSNSTLVLFAGMFVIGASLFHTGLAQAMGEWVVRKTGKGELALLWGTMTIAAVLSTFASNTGTTAALIPVILSICRTAGIPASRQLMPMAFTTGYGGFSTLVGTPPNVIVTEALRQGGHRPFGFFEFAWVGIPLALAGMVYLSLIGRRLLPDRACPPEGTAAGPTPKAPALDAARTAALKAATKEADAALALEGRAARGSRPRMWLSGLILLAVVVAMATNSKRLPLEVVAVIGALLCVVTGCVGRKAAIESIEWETILLFGAMFAVAEAIQKSGAGVLIADGILMVLGPSPPGWLILASVFLATLLLGTFLSNTACAALLAPIGLSLAERLGASPHAVLMAIATAASCSFLTPLGTPPNTLVLKPGGYRFGDYLVVGSGLSLVCLMVALTVIPLVWPVFP